MPTLPASRRASRRGRAPADGAADPAWAPGSTTISIERSTAPGMIRMSSRYRPIGHGSMPADPSSDPRPDDREMARPRRRCPDRVQAHRSAPSAFSRERPTICDLVLARVVDGDELEAAAGRDVDLRPRRRGSPARRRERPGTAAASPPSTGSDRHGRLETGTTRARRHVDPHRERERRQRPGRPQLPAGRRLVRAPRQEVVGSGRASVDGVGVGVGVGVATGTAATGGRGLSRAPWLHDRDEDRHGDEDDQPADVSIGPGRGERNPAKVGHGVGGSVASEIGGADGRVLGEVRGGVGEDDLAGLEDVAAVCDARAP